MLDVVFVISESDSSPSGATHFKQALDGIKDFASFFTIGVNDVQIALLTYSTEMVERFTFSKYGTASELEYGLDQVMHQPG